MFVNNLGARDHPRGGHDLLFTIQIWSDILSVSWVHD